MAAVPHGLDAPAASTPELRAAFAGLLDRRELSAVFQPVTDLRSGEVVGYEAFARGPEGTDLHRPADLFALAAETGRTTELDWVCRAAAYRGFLDADLPGALSLFVNVDHPSLMDECPADQLPVVGRAESSLRVFLEINDRVLAAHPASLLETIARARDMGWGISIDDIGTSLGCLSVLPLVRPDVVKIDVRSLGARGEPRRLPPVVTTVLQHVEGTGAALAFKGIESQLDVELARAVGARYGQGHHLGAPGPIAAGRAAPRAVIPLVGRPARPVGARSPRDLLDEVPPGRTTRAAMRQVAEMFAGRVLSAGSRPVVLTGAGPWHELEWSTEGDASTELAVLAEVSALVVSFEVASPPEPAAGVRGVRLSSGDPLAHQAFLVLLSEVLSAAIVAEPVDGGLGTVDLRLTQDPELVADVARYLMSRVPPAGPANGALPPPVDEPLDEDWTEPADHPAPPVEQRSGTRWSRLVRHG